MKTSPAFLKNFSQFGNSRNRMSGAAFLSVAGVFAFMFFQADGHAVNSRFWFNNPTRESIATAGIAMLSFMACFTVWNRRSLSVRRHPENSNWLLIGLVAACLIGQIPFLLSQHKVRLFAEQSNTIDAMMDGFARAANDPHSDLSPETRRMILKEIWREGLKSSGDIIFYKEIK
jgi:hypothetical protein